MTFVDVFGIVAGTVTILGFYFAFRFHEETSAQSERRHAELMTVSNAIMERLLRQ